MYKREEAKEAIKKIDSAIRNIEIVMSHFEQDNKMYPDIAAAIDLIRLHNRNHPNAKIALNEFLSRDISNWQYLIESFTRFKRILEEKYDL